MHSTGIEKNGNSTEKIIGGKEAEDGISGRFCVKKWVENLSKTLNMPILMGNMAYFHDSKTAQNGAFFVSPKTGLSDNFQDFAGKQKNADEE